MNHLYKCDGVKSLQVGKKGSYYVLFVWYVISSDMDQNYDTHKTNISCFGEKLMDAFLAKITFNIIPFCNNTITIII